MTDEKQANRVTEPGVGAREMSRTSVEASEGEPEGPTHEEIAARAYQCWQERGCVGGAAEEDWYRAEQELRTGRTRTQGKTYSAAASSL